MVVNVWTVDNPEMIATMAQLGVDYITTNKPALAKEIIEQAEAKKKCNAAGIIAKNSCGTDIRKGD